MRGINRLTDREVKRAEPAAKRQKIGDGGSLFLVLEPNGTKLWRMPYSHAGKQKELAFGVYPTISLAEARQRRDEAKRLLSIGVDPSVEKRKRKAPVPVPANESAPSGPVFRDVARRWYDKQQSTWTQNHKNAVWTSLDQVVFPIFGDKALSEIKAHEVLVQVVEPMEKLGQIEKAQRVVQRMRAVFAFARSGGIMSTDNPCADISGAMQPKPKVRPRPAITSLPELRDMLRVVEAIPCHSTTRLATRFIALTAMRPGNVNSAEWCEIVGDCWHLPSGKMKADRPFTVPLSRQALEVLEAVRSISGDSRFLFPGGRSSLSPMSENALTYYLNRAGFQHLHCSHGWRSSFSSIMNLAHPQERHIIDFSLAHVPKDKVEAAYNRAEYLARRREHLQEWADLLLEGFPPAASLLDGRRR